MAHKTSLNSQEISSIWTNFKSDFDLSTDQVSKFEKYYKMLIEDNELFNITAITGLQEVVKDHFSDSLYLSKFLDFSKINTMCDVGTGGGFPGIPLKIKYPHLKVILIEVTGKKIAFLRKVIQSLALENIEIYTNDWRTFLRKSEYDVDLFCSRASLQPEDLIRVFSPAYKYMDSQLVYWASKDYEPGEKILKFLDRQESYNVGRKLRKFVFLKGNDAL